MRTLLFLFCLSTFGYVVCSQSNEQFVDAVVLCAPKDVETLELCVQSIKKYCSPVRRIIVVSAKKFTDKAEWFDETAYPFTKHSMLNELFKGNKTAVTAYLKRPKNQAGWIYQQLLKLYAPFVIPNIADDVLIVDSDVVFLNNIQFIDALGYRLYCGAQEYFEQYFNFMRRLLPGFKRVLPFSGVCHHMLMRRSIIEKMFSKICVVHKSNEAWQAICKVLRTTSFSGACISEYELYANFAYLHDPQFKIRYVNFVNSHDIAARHKHKNCYAYAAFHTWQREAGVPDYSGAFGINRTYVFVNDAQTLVSDMVQTIKQVLSLKTACTTYLIAPYAALKEFEQTSGCGRDVVCIDLQKIPHTSEHRLCANNPEYEAYMVAYDVITYFNLQNVFYITRKLAPMIGRWRALPLCMREHGLVFAFKDTVSSMLDFLFIKNRDYGKKLATYAVDARYVKLNMRQIFSVLKNRESASVASFEGRLA